MLYANCFLQAWGKLDCARKKCLHSSSATRSQNTCSHLKPSASTQANIATEDYIIRCLYVIFNLSLSFTHSKKSCSLKNAILNYPFVFGVWVVKLLIWMWKTKCTGWLKHRQGVDLLHRIKYVSFSERSVLGIAQHCHLRRGSASVLEILLRITEKT